MILDTNALSDYLDNDPGATAAIGAASELAIPVIVAGEFAFGLAQSRNRDAYARSLHRMLSRSRVLSVDIDTSRHYAAIRLELKLIGKAIPANDLWIAALCRQHDGRLLSRDTHFDHVPHLERVAW